MVVFDEERRIAELRAQKAAVQQEIINALEMKMQLGKAVCASVYVVCVVCAH